VLKINHRKHFGRSDGVCVWVWGGGGQENGEGRGGVEKREER